MKKMRFITLVLSAILLLGSVVSAADFSDMPTDPAARTVIENAVKNGLLAGSDGKVNPDAYITRAEMAAIITRACGVTEEKDLSDYVDVPKEKWYYSPMAKAYYMGAISGSGNKMSPEDHITFQESFVILSRVFFLYPSYIKTFNPDIGPGPGTYNLDGRIYDISVLDNFSDGQTVADWAKVYYAGVVLSGGWQGQNGLLTPTERITRLQFATVMDNLFKNYIDTPGEYNTLPNPAGNTIVRCDGAILNGLVTDGTIFIADNVGPNKVIINNVTAKGGITVRGCATPVVDENGGVSFGEYGLIIGGKFGAIKVIRPYINVDIRNAEFDFYRGVEYTGYSAWMKQ